ncbi:hypothetical protein GWI33_004029, partial [Rhynchophorus ferrugineus]
GAEKLKKLTVSPKNMEKKTRKYYERGVNKEHLAELAKPKRRISLEEEADINRSRKKPSSKYKDSYILSHRVIKV